jgi:aldose 1-epimerase
VGDVQRDLFGILGDGAPVERYTLTNRYGSCARWITWGATLTELWVPDPEGVRGDVVLGFDDLASYERNPPHFGCTIGRVANRIAGAAFELDGVRYALAANDGANHLHGGEVGFGRKVWDAEPVAGDGGPALRFSLTSPDGDEGYPGTLRVSLTVRFADDDALHLDYQAETDTPTLVNLTNHTYWNLAGGDDVLGHELTLHADRFTEPAPGLLPTGRVLSVAGGPLDFRSAKAVGRDLAATGSGYDHNFVLADAPRAGAAAAGELYDPVSGRRLGFATSEPGVQLYTANFLRDVRGKRGAVHGPHAGLCLEAQRFPDAIHHPAFPSVVLRPGEVYRQQTVYRF